MASRVLIAKLAGILDRLLLPHSGVSRLLLRFLALNCLVIAIVIPLGVLLRQNPHYLFGEGKPATWLSFLQLLGIAYLANRTYEVRRGKAAFAWKHSSSVWRIISAGFVFLAFDELLRFHERVDFEFHHLLQLTPTEITDHLDDALVMCYAAAGLAILWYFRREILRYAAALPWFVAASILFVVMTVVDFFGNSESSIAALAIQTDQVVAVMRWLAVIEDSLKNFAEVFFLAGFACCYQLAEGLSPSADGA